jgi:hypothetical protein
MESEKCEAPLLFVLFVALSGPGTQARTGSPPPLMASVRLFAWHRYWHPVDWGQMVNGDPL